MTQSRGARARREARGKGEPTREAARASRARRCVFIALVWVRARRAASIDASRSSRRGLPRQSPRTASGGCGRVARTHRDHRGLLFVSVVSFLAFALLLESGEGQDLLRGRRDGRSPGRAPAPLDPRRTGSPPPRRSASTRGTPSRDSKPAARSSSNTCCSRCTARSRRWTRRATLRQTSCSRGRHPSRRAAPWRTRDLDLRSCGRAPLRWRVLSNALTAAKNFNISVSGSLFALGERADRVGLKFESWQNGRRSRPGRQCSHRADGERGARHASRVRHPHEGVHPPPKTTSSSPPSGS